jgi:hypothetical protein
LVQVELVILTDKPLEQMDLTQYLARYLHLAEEKQELKTQQMLAQLHQKEMDGLEVLAEEGQARLRVLDLEALVILEDIIQ